jgi:peptidoglycan/LPS O-acetylase OafA/YrhL
MKKPKRAPISDATSGPEIDAVPGPIAESVGEPVPGPIAESGGEPVPEPIAESGGEPVPEPIAEPVGEPVPEPIAEPVGEPAGKTASEPASERSTFRPDLQGLRAVAVVLVVLFHAGVPVVSGGFVGVDVFFVLSGFLITGLLVRELSGSARVDFGAFYARRVRRLLPAAALTLIATIAAAAVLLPPVRMPDVTGDTIAAALYASNIRFALQATDYLGSKLAPSPVLHFWSLGVEEQFYLFWPALMAVTAGAAFAAGRHEAGLRRVAAALGVVFVLSLAVSLWLTSVAQPWAFFSLPARAWELALGGLLALPAAARFVPLRLAPWLGWAGVALIVAAGLLITATTAFPGVAALVPTLGSALVIASGLHIKSPSGVPVDPAPERAVWTRIVQSASPAAVLSLPPLQFLGRISYSLYLWHWPILVLPAAASLTPLPPSTVVALAALAIAVAAASERWVERPIRSGRFVGLAPRPSLAYAGMLPVLVAAIAVSSNFAAAHRLSGSGAAVGGSTRDVVVPTASLAALPVSSSAPSGSAPSTSPSLPPLAAGPVPADLVPSLANALDDLPVIYSDGCHLDIPTTASGSCVYGNPSSTTTVVLFGDSHAAQWFPALERLANEHFWRLVSLTKSSCPPAELTVWDSIDKRAYAECDMWRQAVFARIAAEHPALVVVANARDYEITVDGVLAPVTEHADLWGAALKRTLLTLEASAAHVVVIGDTPSSTSDPPSCLSSNLLNAGACAVPYVQAVDPVQAAEQAAIAAAAGAGWIDPAPLVCRSDPCPAILGRFLIYRDGGHLTATYARAIAEPLFTLLPPLGPPPVM